ncbi:MAG: DUF4129 domain-containing protein [Chloroflexi bacterium]|nr:DUF4129 domain-containing protein [Chloroflexota bacterium]
MSPPNGKALKPAQAVLSARGRGWLARGLGPGGDGLTLLLAAFVLLNVTWLLERAGWEERLPSLSGIAIAALVLGAGLARSRLPGVASHLIAGLIGAGLTIGLAASAMARPGWGGKLTALMRELAFWAKAVPGDSIREGNIEFLVLLVALFWGLGYLAAWQVLRRRQAWWLVIPGGVVLLIALGHLPEGFYFHALLYLVASALLLVHVSLLRRQQDWGRERRGYRPSEGLSRLAFVGVFALVAVLATWRAPVAEAAPLGAVMEAAKAPWEFAQDQFSRLFAALPAKTPFVTLRWGNSLAFGSPPQLSDQALFTVESREPHYWRARVYDTYTYLGWSSSPTVTRLLSDELTQDQSEPLALRARVNHSVRLNAATDTLFGAGPPVRTSLPALALTRLNQPADILAARSGSELRLSQKYSMVSSVSAAKPDDLRGAGSQYPGWVSESYLQLPANFPQRVRRLARELTTTAVTQYDKAIAIRDYLKTLPYNLNVKAPPQGRDGVDYFLFTQKAGYCDYYASAMATMLRSVGVPARFVVGYATGEWDNAKKAYVVRELHYHSWVEAYFPAYGWVEFEPTPPEAVEFTNQPALNTPLLSDLEEDGEAPLPEDDSAVEISQEGAGPLPWVVTGISLLAAIMLATVWYQWWGKLTKLGYAAETYAKMGRLGALAHLAPEPHLTPREYAERLCTLLPEQAGSLRYVAAVYSETRYGARKLLRPDAQERLARAWREVRLALLRSALKRGQTV